MKRILLSLFLIASFLLPAANLSQKVVRLEVINKSGANVYIELEGEGTGSFYYLTVTDATTKTFSLLADYYKRKTWTCDRFRYNSRLNLNSNTRLAFVDKCSSYPPVLVYQISDKVERSNLVVMRSPRGERTMEKVPYFNLFVYIRNMRACNISGRRADCVFVNPQRFRFRY
ncbi:MAG: hypothetical protein A2Z16_06625 [Chloroflexi bacterium RBG_16_54_18]|nr:MAG: hypothetical protein A2Z16_06625 [Chloroflexi bacterium RBG_16_54_18]